MRRYLCQYRLLWNHITQVIFVAGMSLNTAYLPFLSMINPMAIPDTGRLIFTPASISANVPANRSHRRGTVWFKNIGYNANGIRAFIFSRKNFFSKNASPDFHDQFHGVQEHDLVSLHLYWNREIVMKQEFGRAVLHGHINHLFIHFTSQSNRGERLSFSSCKYGRSMSRRKVIYFWPNRTNSSTVTAIKRTPSSKNTIAHSIAFHFEEVAVNHCHFGSAVFFRKSCHEFIIQQMKMLLIFVAC